MRKKIAIIMCVCVTLSIVGCGKQNASENGNITSRSEATSNINSKMQSEISEIQKSEIKGAVDAVADETGLYPDSMGCAEISLGIKNCICTMKVPFSYIFSGTYYNDAYEASDSIEGMDESTTVKDSMEKGLFETYIIDQFAMTSLDAVPTELDAIIYDVSTGTLDDLRVKVPGGTDVGTMNALGYGYTYQEGEKKVTQVAIQISEEYILYLNYSGPVTEQISEEELVQKIYDLVTIK